MMDKTRIAAGLGALAMVACAFAVFWFDPSGESFFPVCPLYKVTGFACPGCGMTRSFHALVHGDIIGAFRFNLFMPLMLGFIAYIFVSLTLLAIRGKSLSFEIFSPRITWTIFVLLMIFGVVRNIPVYPFNILFP